jgi:hypothetical protein
MIAAELDPSKRNSMRIVSTLLQLLSSLPLDYAVIV